jgi:acetyl-CoA acyltransferase
MKKPVIVDAVRTPMGKSKKGIYRNIRAETLGVTVVNALLTRNEMDPTLIDEVIFGCANQQKEQGFNIARFVTLQSHLPAECTAKTINFLCGSSLEAINDAARQIMIGEGVCYIAAGVEHMGHIPMDLNYDENSLYCLSSSRASQIMGYTAEYVSIASDVDRRDQDVFSERSHRRASKADFSAEIVSTPSHLTSEGGSYALSSTDEPIRPSTTAENLSSLPPAFNKDGGSVTAGNSSSVADGAAALLVMEREFALSLGFSEERLVEVKSFVRAGVSPSVMGYGPVPAVERLLTKESMSLNDIDIIELNEAFAAQSLACLDGLGIGDPESYDDKVNIKGGAIALGHPLGCSGARISTTLYHEMVNSDKETGIATMCVGLGQGIATLFKR